MKKALVAYFSCTGTTKRVAKTVAVAAEADLYEIQPQNAYTAADLNWMDNSSRCNTEMKDRSSRPEINGKAEGMRDYEVIFLGFPIWWYVAPHIINTFLESYDFSGKIIVPFATSGGSGLGKTVDELKKSCSSSAKFDKGRVLNTSVSKSEIFSWVKQFVC